MANGSAKEKVLHRLCTPEGRETYGKRHQTVEPVFGIIKQALSFRQFLLRGIEKVSIEWNLITLAYNFKRLHTLSRGTTQCGMRPAVAKGT